MVDGFREADETHGELVSLVLVAPDETVRGEGAEEPMDDRAVETETGADFRYRETVWVIRHQVKDLEPAIQRLRHIVGLTCHGWVTSN